MFRELVISAVVASSHILAKYSEGRSLTYQTPNHMVQLRRYVTNSREGITQCHNSIQKGMVMSIL